jgi:hypothetical protein
VALGKVFSDLPPVAKAPEEDVRVIDAIGEDSVPDETAHPLVVMLTGALLKHVFPIYSSQDFFISF